MADQLKTKAILVFEKLYPNYQLLFIFDNSSGHASLPKDVLNARKIAKGLGGKQPIIRDGWVLNKKGEKEPFPMTIEVLGLEGPIRIARGAEDTLKTRGLWRDKLLLQCPKPKKETSALNLEKEDENKELEDEDIELYNPELLNEACRSDNCYARRILENQPDFLEQECEIVAICREVGHLCLFLPKYHCELNIIEFF